MSNDETSNEKKESLKNTVNQITSSLLKLKDSNPKVFYGGIGGVIIVLLIMMMSGGGPEIISGPVVKNLVVGQSYVLRTPNSYDMNSTVRMVGAPGSLEAYDDTEKSDRTGCKHLPQGTPVILKQLADAYGIKNSVAQISVESGECKGTTNWTSSVNVNEK